LLLIGTFRIGHALISKNVLPVLTSLCWYFDRDVAELYIYGDKEPSESLTMSQKCMTVSLTVLENGDIESKWTGVFYPQLPG